VTILILSDSFSEEMDLPVLKGINVLFKKTNDSYELPEDILIGYLDQRSVDCRKECREILQSLKKKAPIPWGLLDFKRTIKDPMYLLLHGWADYLCGKNLFDWLNTERIHNILYFYHNKRAIPEKRESNFEGNFSGKDWSGVKDEEEYLFGMLFIEMLPQENIEAQLSEAEIRNLRTDWESFLSEFFDPWYGYLWISNGWSNVILFPFDGKNLHVLEGVIEFHLNSPTFQFKTYQGMIKYRQVLHIGTAPFLKRGNTANIISESLNDLFHMGMYHAKGDRLYFTEEACSFIPESLLPYLEAPVEFEGHTIHSLKRLL